MTITTVITTIYPVRILIILLALLNLWIPKTNSYEQNTVFQNIKTLQVDRSNFGEDNQLGAGGTSLLKLYIENSFFDQQVESTNYSSNPDYSILGFGFGDTELSVEISLVEESSYTPGIITEISTLVPVDFDNQGAVLQFQELEHVLGLQKDLPFMSFKSSVGQIVLYDQLSDEGFDHYFAYELEVEFQPRIEGLRYGLELSGDIFSTVDEYVKTWVGCKPLDGVSIEIGLELTMRANEMAPEAMQISLKWLSKI